MQRLIIAASLILCNCGTNPGSDTTETLFQLQINQETHGQEKILSVELPSGIDSIRLIETTAGLVEPVPSQIHPGPPARLYWVLSASSGSAVRTFEALSTRKEASGEPYLRTVNSPEGYLEVRQREKPILRYHCEDVPPPDSSMDPIQTRSAYIHPVWTPSGLSVTDDYHPNHPHQRGIWFAWTAARFENREPDFWNLHKGTGTVSHDRILSLYEGPVFGGFRVSHHHVDLSAPEGEQNVLHEIWDVRVYSAGGSREGFHLFDIDSIQRSAAEEALRLPEYRYGGMAIRGAREWNEGEVRFLTSTGKQRQAGDGSREHWCMMSGVISNRQAGIVVYSHPKNYRSPQPVRIHPEMPYFVFSPMRLADMEIRPDAPYRSRYRYLVFDGSMTENEIEAHWLNYSRSETLTPE